MEFLTAFEAGVLNLIQLLMPNWLVKPIIKPFVRLILGLLVIPIFRLFLHRVVRKELDEELEKDLSEWVRGSLLLLVATSTMEATFFFWVPPGKDWLKLALRLLLAIGVIEAMPDQALFSIIHPGPPPLRLRKGQLWADLRGLLWPTVRGIFNQHLRRSSAVLAILSVVLDPGPIVWICYGIAIANYLIIGLVCSRDKALDVLSRFDKAVLEQREELKRELELAHPDEHGLETAATVSSLPEFSQPAATVPSDQVV